MQPENHQDFDSHGLGGQELSTREFRDQLEMNREELEGLDSDLQQEPHHESVLDAIREGDWTFEPDEVGEGNFDDTAAMLGSSEKIDIMADRVRQGLPIWHSSDRRSFGEG